MSAPGTELVTKRPGICLNMIVRNEAHVIAETLNSVAPYISSWVIVDTGSDDGTPDVIRNHMAGLGIPGELHERPWRGFSGSRNEALDLAQGHGDYIWVIDADDILVGTPDFSQLSADIYLIHYVDRVVFSFWRPQVFRDGVLVRYKGVIHEYPTWDDSYDSVRYEGPCHIEYRQLGARSMEGQKYARDRDLLLAELERNPDDARSVFLLAQSYFSLEDCANALVWYQRRAVMGDSGEQVYLSLFQIGQCLQQLGAPWAHIQEAFLKAWEFRPNRAEALWSLATRYRLNQRYQLGYLFARRAVQIPFSDEEALFIRPDIYIWRSADEQAVCASWIGRQAEAFALWRGLLARPDLPDQERPRMTGNRDMCVPTMIDAASRYPDAVVQSLLAGSGNSRDEAQVVVSLIAGPDRATTEQTLNSFLNCCTDASRIGRFLVVDTGLSAQDRATLLERYGFLEIVDPGPATGTGAQLAYLCTFCTQGGERLWLHLGQGWQFFAPENFITRLAAVLDVEPQVFQVGINFTDAAKLTGTCAAEDTVRRAPDAGRYVLADVVARGPAMFDTTRLDRAGGINAADPNPLTELGCRAAAVGLHTASLDEVLCVTAT